MVDSSNKFSPIYDDAFTMDAHFQKKLSMEAEHPNL